MENNAIKLLIRALEEDATQAKPGFRIHIAHLADSGSMADIETAKKKGARTCLVLLRSFQDCNFCIDQIPAMRMGGHYCFSFLLNPHIAINWKRAQSSFPSIVQHQHFRHRSSTYSTQRLNNPNF